VKNKVGDIGLADKKENKLLTKLGRQCVHHLWVVVVGGGGWAWW